MAFAGCSYLFKTDIKYVTYEKNQKYCLDALQKFSKVAKHYDVLILSARMRDPFYYLNKDPNLFTYEVEKTIRELLKTAKIIILISNAYYMEHFYINEIIYDKKPKKNILNIDSEENQAVKKLNLCLKHVASKYKNVYYVDFTSMLCNENIVNIEMVKKVYIRIKIIILPMELR